MKRPSIDRKKVDLGGGRKRRIGRLPNVATISDFDGDPLANVQYDNEDLEASAESEMSEILRQLKERRKAGRERYRIARNTDYFLAICFQSGDQKDEFLAKSGWSAIDGWMVNGLEVARRLGLDVVPIKLEPLPFRGRPKKFKDREVV